MTTSKDAVLERQVLRVGLDPVELEPGSLGTLAARLEQLGRQVAGRDRSRPARRPGCDALPVPAATSSTRWPGLDPARLDQPRPERQEEGLDHRGVVPRGPHLAVAALQFRICSVNGHRALLVRMGRRYARAGPPYIGRSPYLLPVFSSRAAWAAASARLCTPSLERMWLTWWPAVFSAMTRVCGDLGVGHARGPPARAPPARVRSARRWLRGRGPGGLAQLAQDARGGVHRPRRTQLAEGGERGARLVAGQRRATRPTSARASASRASPACEGHAPAGRTRPARGARARQPRRDGPRPAPRAPPPAPRGRPTSRMPDCLGQARPAARRRPRRPRGPRRPAGPPPAGPGAGWCAIASPSAAPRARSRSAAATCGWPSAMRRWASAHSDDGMLLAPGQQLLGLRQPALAHAQLGHAGDGRRAHRRARSGRGSPAPTRAPTRPRASGRGPRARRRGSCGRRRAAGIAPVLARELVDQVAPLARRGPSRPRSVEAMIRLQ